MNLQLVIDNLILQAIVSFPYRHVFPNCNGISNGEFKGPR